MSATSHLWVLIHKHQSEIQALGPFATLGAAFIAAGVAVYFGRAQTRINDGQRQIAASQRDIASTQRDIAKMRVRMDLHAKRYEIMLAARDLMGEAISAKVDRVRLNKLRRVLAEGSFLFPTHIADIVVTIDTACAHAAVLGIVNQPSEETIAHANAAQMRVAQHLDQWPAPFSEIMTFRDVE